MRSKLLITLLIIMLLVVYYLYGMDYMKQREEHEVLTSQITEVTEALEALREIPEPPQDLEQRLAAAQASLATEQSAFPDKINNTEVVDIVLKLAEDSQVKAIPLVTEPWSMERVGEHDYHVFRLTVTVEGSFSQLVSFVSKLEQGEYKTLIIEDLSVTRVTEGSEEETVPEGTIPITANLDLAIYTQSPVSD